ncbi:MAG: DUF87 domain-containing protein [Anaerolineae bacterium]
MPFIEAPTTFYLGRRYDPDSKRLTSDVVYYDSRDLTTHAVVVGMTGSGKTGLCITLLEEAILDNIPSIIIDPKGDITNLLLNFPDLRPEDFQPWVNVDDARRAGMDVPQYAADVAHQWAQGLASWSISPIRMQWLKAAARYSIYTPGSDAGLPVSIVASLRAPRDGWNADVEANREKISGIVTALLALVGRDAQPMQDKEHVLVANIFEYAWQRGQDLTLQDIILQVQKPPFDKLGVFPIDDYIAEKQRQKLALDLNNIVAAPSFQSWLSGDPMDIQSLLYTPEGRPRVSIFYIAHLSESERQFITTLLLENMLGWMRTLSGTTSLRALLYIDEMFGYFPPYPRNPPTKEPLLRLLKQARAFGLGMILATQNPGDLDYKGLSNAGTWMIGRLQSENDKQRVMTGLESLASVDSEMDIKDVGRMIADIPPRVFLMHNVHDPSGPVMVHTRWAMSYLRGPLTRQQVQILMADQRARMIAKQPSATINPSAGASAGVASINPGPGFAAQMAAQSGQVGVAAYAPPSLPEFPTAPAPPVTLPDTNTTPSAPVAVTGGAPAPHGFTDRQPPVPSSIPQYFLPSAVSSQQALADWQLKTNVAAVPGAATLAYRPFLLAQLSVRYQDRKSGLYSTRQYAYLISDVDHAGMVRWEEAETAPLDMRRLSGEPFAAAYFGDLLPGMTDARRMTSLKREIVDVVYASKGLQIPFNSTLGVYGSPDGDFASFRSQLQQMARERRDAEMDALTAKYEDRLDRIDDQQRKKLQRRDNERRELADIKREQLFTTGEAMLGLLKGRTAFTLSRMSRASVYKQRSKGQLEMAELEVQQLEEDKAQVAQDYEAKVRAINERWAKVATTIEQYQITPFKKDISLDLFGIGWLPYWYVWVNNQPLLLAALG